MNSKQRLNACFNFEQTDRLPWSPHWWGMYKFQLAGICNDYDDPDFGKNIAGKTLDMIDEVFYQEFKPDLLHLSSGGNNLITDEWFKEYYELRARMKELNSFSAIDDFVKHINFTKEQIESCGIYDHVAVHAKNHPDVMIAMNEGNPIGSILDSNGYIGFEDGLIAMLENPEHMAYLTYECYRALLPGMQALRAKGSDAYIGSETFISSDLISPKMYREIILPAQQHFYTEIEKIGLTPITYFLGDVMPYIDDIATIGARAMMVEEGKKGFDLDAADVQKKLYGRIAVFGNLDGVDLVGKGTPQQVYDAAMAQIERTKDKRGFVVASGSPLVFDTPKENILALRKAAEDSRN